MNGRGRTILGATAALMLLIGLHAGGAPPGLGLEYLVGTAHAQGAKKPAPAQPGLTAAPANSGGGG